jgi:TatD-related deoxyribonuclease
MPTPVLDDHCHLDADRGRGVEAVKAFARAGGTHLLICNQPSWRLGVAPTTREDFRTVFDRTIDIVSAASDALPGRAWPVLGVHPALISRLVDDRGYHPSEAADLMQAGLNVAADYAADGPAVALKSGRPHYEVGDAVWEASNRVLRHALELGAETGVAVQLHTEASDEFLDVADWAAEAGVPPENVVKHYAEGPTSGVTPSVIARKGALEAAAAAEEPFLMETDFLDDPDRPGAVLGPKTVPRRVNWLLEAGYDSAVRTAHVDAPQRVYGIDIEPAL